MLFIFSVMSFAFLYNNFYQTDDGDLYCDTLLQCFVTVVRYGLIDNLGLVRETGCIDYFQLTT